MLSLIGQLIKVSLIYANIQFLQILHYIIKTIIGERPLSQILTLNELVYLRIYIVVTCLICLKTMYAIVFYSMA